MFELGFAGRRQLSFPTPDIQLLSPSNWWLGLFWRCSGGGIPLTHKKPEVQIPSSQSTLAAPKTVSQPAKGSSSPTPGSPLHLMGTPRARRQTRGSAMFGFAKLYPGGCFLVGKGFRHSLRGWQGPCQFRIAGLCQKTRKRRP